MIGFIGLLGFIVFVGLAGAWTFEGELDPDKFAEWPQVQGGMISSTIIQLVAKNPDPDAQIKHVKMIVFLPTQKLIRYSYFKDNEPFVYRLDPALNKYVRVSLTAEERGECIKCHQGGKDL